MLSPFLHHMSNFCNTKVRSALTNANRFLLACCGHMRGVRKTSETRVHRCTVSLRPCQTILDNQAFVNTFESYFNAPRQSGAFVHPVVAYDTLAPAVVFDTEFSAVLAAPICANILLLLDEQCTGHVSAIDDICMNYRAACIHKCTASVLVVRVSLHDAMRRMELHRISCTLL